MAITKRSLEALDNRIWDRLHIDSGGSMAPWAGGSAELWQKYQDVAEKELRERGISEKNKVPEDVRRKLESDNYHSLNQVIDFTNLGEGKYGLTKKDFYRGKIPRKTIKPQISIHSTAKHKKLSRKAKKVGQHGAIRDTCIYCEMEHSTDRHRFHGRNSYARTHSGTGRKREERII